MIILLRGINITLKCMYEYLLTAAYVTKVSTGTKDRGNKHNKMNIIKTKYLKL